MLELMMSHIEHKHGKLLSRDYTMLKNRAKMGRILPQRCRARTKIRELSGPGAEGGAAAAPAPARAAAPKALIQECEAAPAVPE